MSREHPTINDVAKLAGVSCNAVSRVCNPQPKGYVAEETRLRVLNAIRELGYRPDMRARYLRDGRTGTIGFYTVYGLVVGPEFGRAIFNGLQAGCANANVDMLIFRALDGDGASVAHELCSSKVDGVIYHPRHGDSDLAEALLERHKPAVRIGESYPGLLSVVSDDVQSGGRMANYLHLRGHRKVLFRKEPRGLELAQRRYVGFCEAASRLGIELVTTSTPLLSEELTAEEADLLRHFGRSRITAVACWRDHSAARVLRFCRDNDIVVPEDLAVVGFDGITPDICPAEFRITTAVIDWQRIAEMAVDLLVEQINGAPGLEELVVASAIYQGNTA